MRANGRYADSGVRCQGTDETVEDHADDAASYEQMMVESNAKCQDAVTLYGERRGSACKAPQARRRSIPTAKHRLCKTYDERAEVQYSCRDYRSARTCNRLSLIEIDAVRANAYHGTYRQIEQTSGSPLENEADIFLIGNWTIEQMLSYFKLRTFWVKNYHDQLDEQRRHLEKEIITLRRQINGRRLAKKGTDTRHWKSMLTAWRVIMSTHIVRNGKRHLPSVRQLGEKGICRQVAMTYLRFARAITYENGLISSIVWPDGVPFTSKDQATRDLLALLLFAEEYTMRQS